MGLRCLLGHDFGPPGVVREHEEDGNEMVVTEREIQICKRCGDEQVLSESTEVRAIRSEAEMGLHDEGVEAVTPASETESSVDADETSVVTETADVETDSATTTNPVDAGVDETDLGEHEHGPDDRSPQEDDHTESDTSLIERAEAGLDDSPTPGEEDAVILDEESEATERGHGEWPDSDDVGAPSEVDAEADSDAEADADAEAESPERTIAETAAEEDAELLDETADTGGAATPAENANADVADTDPPAEADQDGWPDHDGSDEGFAADTASSGGPDVSFGNSLTPQSRNGEHGEHVETETAAETDEYETSYPSMAVEERDGDGTIVSARGGAAARDPRAETEYYCPNCDHSRPLGSSLREGDICPECQRGYIAERER